MSLDLWQCCEECGVSERDDNTVQLRNSGKVLCEDCCDSDEEED